MTLKIDGNFFTVYYTFKTNAIHHAKLLNNFFEARLYSCTYETLMAWRINNTRWFRGFQIRAL